MGHAPPAGERQDWYFFGYAHDYRKALGDYVRVPDASRCRRVSLWRLVVPLLGLHRPGAG